MSDSVVSDFAPALSSTKQTSVNVTATATSSSSAWGTGDYKVSAKASDHDDPTGGRWLLCDASAIDSAYTGLIALVGANRPDARGRTLVMQGTHADVSTLLANDGVAVANRRPKHRHTPHTHTITASGIKGGTGGASNGGYTGWDGTNNYGSGSPLASATNSSVDGGSGNANDALDTPSFLVPGNLFIHT